MEHVKNIKGYLSVLIVGLENCLFYCLVRKILMMPILYNVERFILNILSLNKENLNRFYVVQYLIFTFANMLPYMNL